MVDFTVEFEEGKARYESAPCFGKLKHGHEMKGWEGKGTNPVCVTYRPVFDLVEEKVLVRWFNYLRSHKVWGKYSDYVETDKRHAKYEVTVSAEANPHLLLNTLSMYRHVSTHPSCIEAWHNLVEAGCDPDAAAYCALLMRSTDNGIIVSRYEDSEHTVVSRRSATVDTLKNYVHNFSRAGVYTNYLLESEDRSYIEVLTYAARGEYPVAFWVDGYDPGGKRVRSKDVRLEEQLVQGNIRVVFDKVQQAVLGVYKEDTPAKTEEEIAALANHINELAAAN